MGEGSEGVVALQDFEVWEGGVGASGARKEDDVEVCGEEVLDDRRSDVTVGLVVLVALYVNGDEKNGTYSGNEYVLDGRHFESEVTEMISRSQVSED